MKLQRTSSPSLVISLVSALALCPAVIAQSHWNAPHVVTWNCSGCHAIDGNSQLPYVPRLGGLDAAYLEKKMGEFRAAAAPPSDELFSRLKSLSSPKHVVAAVGASSNEARINMIGIARDLTAAETKSSVAWYAAQKFAPGRTGNADLIQQGRVLFLNGHRAERLLPCQSCHGSLGEGKGQAPRIAGQNGDYLFGELEKFKNGDRKHAPEMTMVAQKVDVEEFRALVAYIQSL